MILVKSLFKSDFLICLSNYTHHYTISIVLFTSRFLLNVMFAIQQPKSQQCKYKQKHKEDLICLNLIQIISK